MRHEESATMEVELISTEIIKPSTPTSPHLRIYPLSFIDNMMYRNYIPVALFYHPNESDKQSIISNLKNSLSEVLTRYYPFAGRLRDQLSIECNDEGVPFRVTEIKGEQSTILQNPNETLLRLLFPDKLPWKVTEYDESIAAVQINFFSCGGLAITACVCHKMGDATTTLNFVNDWAAMTKEKGEALTQLSLPLLNGGVSVFPHKDMPCFPEIVFGKGNKSNAVCRRFVFPPSKINSLKEMVTSHGVQNPSRVEVITAWIYMRAVHALGLTFDKTSFRQVVSLRRRMTPPLPNKSVGNMFWFLYMCTPGADKDEEIELHDLVAKTKANFADFCEVYPKKFGGEDKDVAFISKCMNQGPSPLNKPPGYDEIKDVHNLFIYTSWCGFPLYNADFGWGKPLWATTCGWFVSNGMLLTDTRDGRGVEVIVNMEEEDIVRFERDVELLQYATLNPSREITY